MPERELAFLLQALEELRGAAPVLGEAEDYQFARAGLDTRLSPLALRMLEAFEDYTLPPPVVAAASRASCDIERFPEDANLDFTLLDNYDDPDFPVINIEGNKGDFLLWHSFLPHSNGTNFGTKPRMCQYITMWPVDLTCQKPACFLAPPSLCCRLPTTDCRCCCLRCSCCCGCGRLADVSHHGRHAHDRPDAHRRPCGAHASHGR